MANYRRSRQNGGTFFFTVVAYQRKPILTDPAIREALRKSIVDVRADMPFRIDAWVLLPDHMHCIWTLPGSDHDFSRRWGRIKAGCSRRLVANGNLDTAPESSRQHRNERAHWQRRFWEHQVRDQADFNRHLDYLHFNPVKHGLVDNVSDWAYSSFHGFVKAGLYARDWAGTREFGEGFGE